MTETRDHRLPRGLVFLALGVVVGGLVVSLVHGIAAEYADVAAPWPRQTGAALAFGGPFMAVAWGLLAVAFVRATAGSWVRPAAVALAVLGLLAMPVAQVAGVETKWDRYQAAPDCVGEFRSGPAAPVVRAAQAAYDEIEHPGRFGGGGSSGIDGCETGLSVRGDGDVLAAYRDQLPQLGWTVTADSADLLRAERGGQEIEVRPDAEGARIWIGPAGLRPRDLEEGEVAPRE